MDHGLAYEALARGSIDVADAYSTDAKIARYGLKVLADDRQFFPSYEAVFLYRAGAARRAPRPSKHSRARRHDRRRDRSVGSTPRPSSTGGRSRRSRKSSCGATARARRGTLARRGQRSAPGHALGHPRRGAHATSCSWRSPRASRDDRRRPARHRRAARSRASAASSSGRRASSRPSPRWPCSASSSRCSARGRGRRSLRPLRLWAPADRAQHRGRARRHHARRFASRPIALGPRTLDATLSHRAAARVADDPRGDSHEHR